MGNCVVPAGSVGGTLAALNGGNVMALEFGLTLWLPVLFPVFVGDSGAKGDTTGGSAVVLVVGGVTAGVASGNTAGGAFLSCSLRPAVMTPAVFWPPSCGLVFFGAGGLSFFTTCGVSEVVPSACCRR